MPSIAQAQAKFNAAKAETLFGINKTGNPILGTVEAMLSKYAEEFIKQARETLINLGKDNTGDLGDSIDFVVTRLGTKYTLSINVLDYYKYVDEGVRGRNSKYNVNKTSPYKYTAKPSASTPSHAESIVSWLKEGKPKSKAKDVRKYGVVGKTEAKSTMQQNTELATAKRIAYFIKRKGLKRTGFWTDSFNETFKDLDQKLSEALGQDIIIDLRNLTRGIKKK